MFLKENEVRNIIRKNILKSIHLLNEQSTQIGDFTYTRGTDTEVQGEKGRKLVARDANNKVVPAETIFVPDTFPDSGVPQKRGSDKIFAPIEDEEMIKNIKAMFGEVTEANLDDVITSAKALTSEMNDLLNKSPKDIFMLALRSSKKDGPQSSIAKILATMNSKFAALNKGLKDAGKLKNESGIFINVSGGKGAKTDNIMKVPHDGGDLAQYIQTLNDKGTAAASGMDLGRMFGVAQKPKVLKEVIEDMVSKKYSILNFAELSLQYSEIGEAKGVGNGSIIEGYLGSTHGLGGTRSQPLSDFYDKLFGATGQNPLAKEYDASGTLKILNSDALIGNTVPLFYLNIGDKPVPIFTKGKNSYKNLVERFVEGLTGQTSGTTTQAQQSGGGGGTSGGSSSSSIGDSRRVGGIRMTVQVDGQPDIKTLDDLGFKKGTDKALRQVLRKMVKNERKFKGTGNINLEVRYSGGGNKIKVKRKRGQRRSASRQIEGNLYKRIKEYLTRAKYESTKATDPNDPSDVTNFSDPTRQQWLASDGVKEKLSMRNRSGGRKEYFFNLTIKMF